MNVRDWAKKEKETIDAFCDWWDREHFTEPARHTEQLNHSEWDEQYLFWGAGIDSYEG